CALAGRPRPAPGLPRLLAMAMDEGVGTRLTLEPSMRFDEQGRRRPHADVEARQALALLEENLALLLDPATDPLVRERLEWTFVNGDADAPPWGTWAMALMIDAVDRFAGPDALREVVEGG